MQLEVKVPRVAQVVVVAVLKVVVVVGAAGFLRNTLDFFLHNSVYIFNDAGLSSSVHNSLYIFFRMDWFPSKVFLKSY